MVYAQISPAIRVGPLSTPQVLGVKLGSLPVAENGMMFEGLPHVSSATHACALDMRANGRAIQDMLCPDPQPCRAIPGHALGGPGFPCTVGKGCVCVCNLYLHCTHASYVPPLSDFPWHLASQIVRPVVANKSPQTARNISYCSFGIICKSLLTGR